MNLASVSDKVDSILTKIENGEIGPGNGDSNSCSCPEMIPYTNTEIEEVFKDVTGDCSGVEDNEPIIESIPINTIESVFNDVNINCDGVDDNKEITEGIPESSIESLFNSINNC